MQAIPIQTLDPNVEVIMIAGTNNHLHLGPIFSPFKKLEVLRITDSNVPAVGMHSFWGVQSLRILGNTKRDRKKF